MSKTLNSLLKSLDEKDLSINIYYIRHVKQEELYKSVEIDLNDKLTKWLKGNIKKELKKHSDVKNSSFPVVNYNDEFSINDQIAELNLSDDSRKDLQMKKNRMLEATDRNDETDLNQTSFHLVKIESENDSVFYVGYYRSMKKIGGRKKTLWIEHNSFSEIENEIADLGGSISFIIHQESVYIFSPVPFEYAFKYKEHLNHKRDFNLKLITNKNFFKDDESKKIFEEKATHHFFSRGIASMGQDILNDLEFYYHERCKELKEIKNDLVKNPDNEDKIRKENGVLIDIINYIDFDNDNIIIMDSEMDVKPLLHLFQDKIARTFLTKNIQEIIGYHGG